jgi:ABC-type uncharacterized transport system ATPase subunit
VLSLLPYIQIYSSTIVFTTHIFTFVSSMKHVSKGEEVWDISFFTCKIQFTKLV